MYAVLHVLLNGKEGSMWKNPNELAVYNDQNNTQNILLRQNDKKVVKSSH